MAYFRILLHGEGIFIPADDSHAAGFYTTRHIKAASEGEASEKAKALVLHEWKSGPYAQVNRGNIPHLEIESTARISLIDWLRSPNKGYTFYGPEESLEDGNG